MKRKLFLIVMLVSFSSVAFGKIIFKKSYMNALWSQETATANGAKWLSDEEKVRLKDLVLAETGKELIVDSRDVASNRTKNVFVLKSYKKTSTKQKTQANLSFLITAPFMLLGFPYLLHSLGNLSYKIGNETGSSPPLSIAAVVLGSVFPVAGMFIGIKAGADHVTDLIADKIVNDDMAAAEYDEILDIVEINPTASSAYVWLVWSKSQAISYLSLTKEYIVVSSLTTWLIALGINIAGQEKAEREARERVERARMQDLRKAIIEILENMMVQLAELRAAPAP